MPYRRKTPRSTAAHPTRVRRPTKNPERDKRCRGSEEQQGQAVDAPQVEHEAGHAESDKALPRKEGKRLNAAQRIARIRSTRQACVTRKNMAFRKHVKKRHEEKHPRARAAEEKICHHKIAEQRNPANRSRTHFNPAIDRGSIVHKADSDNVRREGPKTSPPKKTSLETPRATSCDRQRSQSSCRS